MHGSPAATSNRTVTEIGYSATELDVLTVARHFFRGLSEPGTHGWRLAFAHAIDRRGAEIGPRLAMAVLDAIEAMRLARDGCFRFSNPCCRCCAIHVTRHEESFMAAYRAAGSGRLDAVRAHALLLCEGAETTGFVAAIEALAEVMRPAPSASVTID
ncbi:hypothetical protein SAMN04488020_101623 [Palleronia marisminoris]|uniref:Uncharacterized protein n=1 Tax=Palleronia marisminoris TaxID=315423 RepID=A0A1Y5RN56_9RHOB|nr:hypothetical protein [Palleronia marisminoris]SFG24227.1 hypothetical protein SAMN04488020_101623 [Palleronia marisminoris]SLN18800.1 hypothetical protein PAM7066_00624 [Palleronia marisminoris]